MMRAVPTVLVALLLTTPLIAQLAPDGLGWGAVHLDADYESVKKTLQGDGWRVYHNLGAGQGEETTYGRRFGATPPARLRSQVKEYRVLSEFWKGTIWDLTVSLQGVDPKGIRAELGRILGQPDEQDEYNSLWRTSKFRVSGFFTERDASLNFLDLEVNERIAKQQLIDQGIEPGEPSGRGPLRRPTPAEAAWVARFLATARDSLPPPPEGFEVVEQSEVVEPTLVDNLDPRRLLKGEYVLQLANREREEAGKQAVQQAMEATRATQQAKIEKAQAEIQTKLDALQQRAGEAAAKGDMATVERIQKEVAQLAAQGDAITKEPEASFQAQLEGKKPKDFRLFVRVAINEDEALETGLRPAEKVAGHPAYSRVIASDEPIEEESETVVILGAWKAAAADGTHQMAARWDPSLPNTMGQNLQFLVRGDSTRVRAYLDAVRWNQLEALLKP